LEFLWAALRQPRFQAGEYWAKRKIDWKKEYLDTVNHPHRMLLLKVLSKYRFGSLLEVGCASGPNLYKIHLQWPTVELGGVDVSKDAIDMAKKYMPKMIFDVKPAHDVFMSTDSCDIVLADMALIYVGPKMINRTLKEMRRICRKHIVLCEFHSTSWLKRTGLRFATGYNAYNYVDKLERLGWYDVQVKKLTLEDWPGGEPQKTYGYIITADR